MTKRDIKFRAWNSIENKYVPDGYMWCAYTGKDQQQDDFPIEQYTGRKDVNGVEIYEGDIVQVRTSHDTPRYCGAIFFENGSFRFAKTDTGVLEGLPIKEEGLFNPFKVIGNVHENSELLEV